MLTAKLDIMKNEYKSLQEQLFDLKIRLNNTKDSINLDLKQ